MTTNGLEAVDKFVRFEVKFIYVTANAAWTNELTITSPDILIPANTPDRTMLISGLGNFTPAGVKIGGHTIARLTRVASVGAAPAADPFLAMLQLHIECDTNGSRNMTTK
jgi:hypothetical protein